MAFAESLAVGIGRSDEKPLQSSTSEQSGRGRGKRGMEFNAEGDESHDTMQRPGGQAGLA